MESTSRSRSWALIVCALAAAFGLGCESPDDVVGAPAAAAPGGVGNAKPACPPECDDDNPCTSDTCDALGRCHHAALANGTTCSDGNVCTQADACQNGTCVGVNAPSGTSCDDGNACTQTDTCQGGSCVGGNPVVCKAADQCHVAGTCAPASGQCSNPEAPNGTSCSDGNACTQIDTCQSGGCVGESPVVCTALDQCHVAGTCDTATGVCSNPDAPNGTSCSDGNACTQTDTCQAGACVGADPVVCTALDQCHDVGTCDTSTGVCSDPPKANGTLCNDGDACTQTDTCQAGACVGANPVVCTAADQCHVAGACNSATGQCSNPAKADGSGCDDGNACTQTDTCLSGACAGGNLVVCQAADQCHDVGSCDPASGQCSNPAKADGAACEDGNACTAGDTCQAGACVGGAAPDCSDGDPCTVDNCDPQVGCFHDAVVCANAGVNNCSGICAGGCSTSICSVSALGCTIGYWKHDKHFDAWPSTDPADPLSPGSPVGGVFSGASLYGLDGDSLLEALQYHGGNSAKGAARNLLRQAVAALLNASNPTVGPGFPLLAGDVVDQVNAALASGDRATMLALAETLDADNNAEDGGCPLD